MTREDGAWYTLCSLSAGPQFKLFILAGSAQFTYVQGQFNDPIIGSFDKQ